MGVVSARLMVSSRDMDMRLGLGRPGSHHLMLKIEVSSRRARGTRPLIACRCLYHEKVWIVLLVALVDWASGAAGSSSSSLYVCIRALLLLVLLVLVSVRFTAGGLLLGPCGWALWSLTLPALPVGDSPTCRSWCRSAGLP